MPAAKLPTLSPSPNSAKLITMAMVKTLETDREKDQKRHGSCSSSSASTSSPSQSPSILLSVKRLMAFFVILLLGSAVYSRWISTYPDGGASVLQLNMFKGRGAGASPGGSCPEYFRWIHEDLKPWKETGITREMVERARAKANFRLVVADGRAYVQHFRKSFQTRDAFTLWGIVQLLRLHRGRLPDLDLMFDCNDTPTINAHDYAPLKEGAPPPPPLFRYCGDNTTAEIVFPDWSFWGWPEINIKPWGALVKDLKEGNMRVGWLDRAPFAFWKGNLLSSSRKQLAKCNPSNGQDWNARIFRQDWGKESKRGFRESNLVNQCTYRYKIYVEGRSWSVSEKYILACDSPSLLVNPKYFDFFSRGLIPLQHYWPINEDHMCSSIRFAVNWGNNHTHKAQLIGKEGSSFIEQQLTVGYVYDFMFHVLNEYSKLLTYKPTVPEEAAEISADSMLSSTHGLARDFMLDSMVDDNTSPFTGSSCTLPPPLDSFEMEMLLHAKRSSIEEVEAWEKRTQINV